ncbi:MAG: hypothetical protein WBD72_05415, partial [Candidatus Acidiferrum sp.]
CQTSARARRVRPPAVPAYSCALADGGRAGGWANVYELARAHNRDGRGDLRHNREAVFPLPDSPTNPRDSPASMRSDTSFTGRTQPFGVGNSTVNPRTSNKDLTLPS